MTRPVAGPVRFDRARGTVLAYCTGCPPWRSLEGTTPAAYRAAAVHVDQVHGDARLAANLRELAARQERDTPTRS